MNTNTMIDCIVGAVYRDNYSTEQRLIKLFEELIAIDLGLEPTDFTITRKWYHDPIVAGATSKDGKQVFIAKQLDGSEYITTYAHELRHVHQIKYNTISDVGYCNYASDVKTYYNQPIEVDAYDYESDWLDIYDEVLSRTHYRTRPLSYEELVLHYWNDCEFINEATGELITPEQAIWARHMEYVSYKTFACRIERRDYTDYLYLK